MLCDRCQSLDLTDDKFILKAEPPGPAATNATPSYQKTKASEHFQVKSGRKWENFSTLENLSKNGGCPLCKLISKAITRYGKNVDRSTSCSLIWEIHGQQSGPSGDGFINKTRWIKLSWNESPIGRQEVYLILVAPPDLLRTNSNTSATSDSKFNFLGRRSGDPEEIVNLMKSWIHQCVNSADHKLCGDNHDTDKAFEDLVEQSYFGVIDVVDMQLKSLPKKEDGSLEPYVALSYVWGKSAQGELPYVTKRQTVMGHIDERGLEKPWKELPRTIQDAISIVRGLGYRYLWIDSLCIVQDSRSSWQLNTSAMHLVYGNAEFTICAADGEDSSAGLRAMKPAASMREEMLLVSDSKDLDQSDSQPLVADCAPRVRLMVTRPLEAVINDSIWNKRAWTFQERILSRRCLIFAEGRVYWECRGISISQDIHTDGRSQELVPTFPLRTLQQLQTSPLKLYMSYVSMFTGRLLTKQRDALAAFQGVSWLLERYMRTSFLFGLPASHLDFALLWETTEVLTPRKRGDESKVGQQICTKDDLGNCTCRAEEESFGAEEFPTWAWAGWMGGKIEYQSGMLEGCSENVRQWLTSHTWIKWHIRDEEGHLQPLWDIISRDSFAPRRDLQFKVDNAWAGYPITLEKADQSSEPGLETKSNTTGEDLMHESNTRYRSRQSRRTPRGNKTDPSQVKSKQAENVSSVDRSHVSADPKLPQHVPGSHKAFQSDEYGRRISDKIHQQDVTLDAILPDWPFGVIRRTMPSKKESSNPLRFMPILQFCTWISDLYVKERDPNSLHRNKTLAQGRNWYDILDTQGDWCGCIALNEIFIPKGDTYKCTFIAISEAKRFTMEECPFWTSYIPKKREESEWDLYYVLLLERNEERGLWERVGLGKVFQAAFQDAGWAEIKLG